MQKQLTINITTLNKLAVPDNIMNSFQLLIYNQINVTSNSQ